MDQQILQYIKNIKETMIRTQFSSNDTYDTMSIDTLQNSIWSEAYNCLIFERELENCSCDDIENALENYRNNLMLLINAYRIRMK